MIRPRLHLRMLSWILSCGCLWLSACTAAPILSEDLPSSSSSVSEASSSSMPEASKTWDPVPEEIAALADKRADLDVLLGLDSRVTRDDLNVTAEIAPYRLQNMLEVLIGLELRPLEEDDPLLEVPFPFSLSFTLEEKSYTYSFTEEKISVNGTDTYPNKPDMLRTLYEDEADGSSGLLTQDIYYLKEDMDFSVQEVSSLELESSYLSGTQTVSFTDTASIQRAMDALGSLVVWRLPDNALPNPKTGGNDSCTFTFADGSSWRYETALPHSVDSRGKELYYGEVSPNYGSLFDPLYEQTGPHLLAVLAGQQLEAEQTRMEYAGNRRDRTDWEESFVYTDGAVAIPLGSDALCKLDFTDGQGNALKPASITASLWQESTAGGEWIALPAPVQEAGYLQLNADPGRYRVQLRATFSEGWAEYQFEYRVADLPAFFWDLGFRNGSDGVTFTRSDSGLSMPGDGNAQYADFILSLGLSTQDVPSSQETGIRENFSITFEYEGESCILDFSSQGITLDGQSCTVARPEQLSALYEPSIPGIDYTGEAPVDHLLRGFLTKDIAAFSEEFPLDRIESIVVTHEKPASLTVYDLSESLGADTSWTEEILIARDWPGDSFYPSRSSFLSYQISLENGDTYELEDQLYRNGEATGWYLVYSDPPKIRELLQTVPGETIKKERKSSAADASRKGSAPPLG